MVTIMLGGVCLWHFYAFDPSQTITWRWGFCLAYVSVFLSKPLLVLLLCSQHTTRRSLRCTVYSTVSASDDNNLWLANCMQLFTDAACKHQILRHPACLQNTPLFISPRSSTDRPFSRAQEGGRCSCSARELGERKGFIRSSF